MLDVYWPLSSDRSYGSPSGVFVDTIRDANLYQLVEFPTRYRHRQVPSLLDLIIVNDENLVSSITQDPPFDKSDHIALVSQLQLSITKCATKTTEKMKQIDFQRLRDGLDGVDWQDILPPSMDVETTWTAFYDCLFAEIERCSHETSRICIPSKPWIDDRV